jgi:hypothetical protein
MSKESFSVAFVSDFFSQPFKAINKIARRANMEASGFIYSCYLLL